MLSRKRLSLVLSAGLALLLVAAALAVAIGVLWAGENESESHAALEHGDAGDTVASIGDREGAHPALDDALKGPHILAGTSASLYYPYGRDLSEFLPHAPLVVVATVTEAEIVQRPIEIDLSTIDLPTPPGGWDAPGRDYKGGRPGPPTGIIEYGHYATRWTLQVEEVIRSDSESAPATVSILGGGATVDGQEIAYPDYLFYRIGERYLVFLVPHPGTIAEPDDYASASGAYSTFLLRDGRVYAPVGPVGNWVPYKDKDEAELLQYVRDEVASVAAGAE